MVLNHAVSFDLAIGDRGSNDAVHAAKSDSGAAVGIFGQSNSGITAIVVGLGCDRGRSINDPCYHIFGGAIQFFNRARSSR